MEGTGHFLLLVSLSFVVVFFFFFKEKSFETKNEYSRPIEFVINSYSNHLKVHCIIWLKCLINEIFLM